MAREDDELGWSGEKTDRELAAMSIEELGAYVSQLRAEIGRAEATIAAKKNHLGAAGAIFKS